MASSSRATTSEGPKYQGYPYVNLPAFGVPTIDSHAASRYANLPRRPLGTAVRVTEEGSSGTQNQNTKSDSDEEPVLYIDLPGEGENEMYVREENSPSQEQRIPIQTQHKREVEDEQVVYIDLPECSGSGVSDRRPEGPSTNVVQETIFYDQFENRRIDVMPQTSGANSPYSLSTISTISPTYEQRIPIETQPRRKDEDEQVVYIDLPECSSSGPRPEDGPSTNVVQDTIFYDQFKNRRIEVMPQTSGANRPYSPSTMRPPQRPTNLNLWSPGSAGSSFASRNPYSSQNSDQPFRNTPAEDFRLSPLPLTDYPEPPPAYTEIDIRSPVSHVGPDMPAANTETSVSPESPQRTRVIVHHQAGGVNANRKVMMCNHCMVTVNSLVVRQVTYETHLVALCCFSFAFIPCVPLVYCCDICKSDIHYCPLCNNKLKKEFKFW